MFDWLNSDRPDLMLAELAYRDDLRHTIEDLIKMFIRDMSEAKDDKDLEWYDQIVDSMFKYDGDHDLATLCKSMVFSEKLGKFDGMANLIRLYIPMV